MLEEIKVENMIYEIRGKQVMFDSDLAKLYGCKNGTKSINLAVKRNAEKFPSDFYFQLNQYEINSLRFQFETTNKMSRTLPYVFTEQGVAMLSSVLNTVTSTIVSINIMRAFVLMRHFMINNKEVFHEISYLKHKSLEHDEKFDKLFNNFNVKQINNNYIFFKGQIYDSYSILVRIIQSAKKELIIIDNYVDNTFLDILSKKNTNVLVTLIGTSKSINSLDIEKFNKQYPSICLINNNSFHDRFIIIDKSILYHLGSSINSIGSKCFAINKIEDLTYLDKITDTIK